MSHWVKKIKVPPQRPVCGAVVACNYRMSHFISTILQPVIQQAKYPCNSTEDMLSRVKRVNETVDLTNCIIGSMDVKALYLSIDIDFAVEKCVGMILQSSPVWRGCHVYSEVFLLSFSHHAKIHAMHGRVLNLERFRNDKLYKLL